MNEVNRDTATDAVESKVSEAPAPVPSKTRSVKEPTVLDVVRRWLPESKIVEVILSGTKRGSVRFMGINEAGYTAWIRPESGFPDVSIRPACHFMDIDPRFDAAYRKLRVELACMESKGSDPSAPPTDRENHEASPLTKSPASLTKESEAAERVLRRGDTQDTQQGQWNPIHKGDFRTRDASK